MTQNRSMASIFTQPFGSASPVQSVKTHFDEATNVPIDLNCELMDVLHYPLHGYDWLSKPISTVIAGQQELIDRAQRTADMTNEHFRSRRNFVFRRDIWHVEGSECS